MAAKNPKPVDKGPQRVVITSEKPKDKEIEEEEERLKDLPASERIAA